MSMALYVRDGTNRERDPAMKPVPAYLITGATGFLGRRLLRRLLQSGGQVIVLARGKRGTESRGGSVEQRVADLLRDLRCQDQQSQVAVIEADLTDLKPEPLAAQISSCLQQFGASSLLAINLAASLKMDFAGQKRARREATRQLNQNTNVQGLDRLLETLDRVDSSHASKQPVLQGLVHFSTCYAHGQRQGLIPEQPLSPDVRTENSYEASKRDGEFHVTCWQATRGRMIPVTIIRPSIVTGPDTTDGYLAWLDVLSEPVRLDQMSGWLRRLIGMQAASARMIDVALNAVRRLRLPFLPLLGNEDGVLDLIDADDVEKFSWLVIERHRDDALPATLRYLHLSNPEAPTLRQVVDMTVSAFGHPDMAPRLVLIQGFWLFAGLLGLLSAIPVLGNSVRALYTRTSMLRPYLMRPAGTRFTTLATEQFFKQMGVSYELRRIDTNYVRHLIHDPLSPAPMAQGPDTRWSDNVDQAAA